MTDKEKIIIDGINVSECEFINDKYFSPCSGCENDNNCYFKQLQRKKQECEELRIKLIQKDEASMFFNTPVEGWDNDPCKICKYKNEYQRYEQALDEIKSYCKYIQAFNEANKCNKTDTETILDIINKAKDGK